MTLEARGEFLVLLLPAAKPALLLRKPEFKLFRAGLNI